MRSPALIVALTLTESVLQVGPGAAQADPASKPMAVRSPVTHQDTLVTGDQIDYTDSGDGRRAVAVHAAPRPAGTQVGFETIGGRDDFLVIPSDAAPYLAAGTIDRDLFNVADLVWNGLDDASAAAVPVLVDFVGEPGSTSLSQQATGLPGASRIVVVPAAGMAGVRAAHDRAAQFWQAIAPPRRTAAAALAGGVERMRLDRTVRVALDQSVPLIGAPAGLDGTGVTVGVVDTGIDADHPDLAGKVVDSANFTEEHDVRDTFGHGTHVAATIAGTGAGSAGRSRGGAVRLDTSSIVVPGLRQASVRVTVDPRIGATGVYGGVLTATSADGSTTLHTPLGYYVPPNRAAHGHRPGLTRPACERPVCRPAQRVGRHHQRPARPGSAAVRQARRHDRGPAGHLLGVQLGPRDVADLAAMDRAVGDLSRDHRCPHRGLPRRPHRGADRGNHAASHRATGSQRGAAPAPAGSSLFIEWQFVAAAQSTWRLYATPAAPARTGTVSLQDFWSLSEPQLTTRVHGIRAAQLMEKFKHWGFEHNEP